MFRFLTTLVLMLSISLPGLVTAEEEYWEYTFRPGDSIWKIAEKYTTSVDNWDEIQKINNIRMGPDRKIRPGTRIVIPVSMLKTQPTPALVIAVSGDARLLRAKGQQSTVTVGTELYNGDQVVTADGQSLRIQFADQSELQVLPNSEVVLDKLSYHKQTGMVDTRIRLNTGSVNTRVEKQGKDSHYEIRTPAAITAVRGTAFRLSSDADNISRTEVTEGIVGVSVGDTEREVREGYGIVAEKDKPLPEPIKLLSAPEISDVQTADKTVLSLSWEKLPEAAYYRYQLATDDMFNQVIIDDSTADNNLVIDPLPPGDYYLRLRGVDSFKLEGRDTIRQYEIQAPAVAAPVVEDDSYWKAIILTGIVVILL
jgi:hypothetical protein